MESSQASSSASAQDSTTARKRGGATPKSEAKQIKAAATLYERKMTEEAKTVRQLTKEHAAKDEELAAARALKKQQRDAATSQKPRNRANKGKRAALTKRCIKIYKEASCCGC